METYRNLGRQFLDANQTERERLAQEFADPHKQQQVIDDFFSPQPPYANVEEFRLELAFFVMVSRWFEPRDNLQFVGEICDRTSRLSVEAVREVARSMSEFMDPTVRNTNLGTLSIRSLVLTQVDQNLERRRPVNFD